MSARHLSPRPEPVTLDGFTFRPETPTGTPIKKAQIYTFLDGGPSIPLQINILMEGHERFAPLADGRGDNSPFRSAQPLPDGIGEWRYEHLTFPAEEFERFHTDITIQTDRKAWLSDFLQAQFVMVRPEPRKVIEELDPDMNYFFPIRVFERETGALVTDEYGYWVPRRRLWFKPSGKTPIEQRLRTVSRSGLGKQPVAWQLKNNQILKDFVSDIPTWTLGSSNIFSAMSSNLFHRLKAEMFSGLFEIEAQYELDRDLSQCIGHF